MKLRHATTETKASTGPLDHILFWTHVSSEFFHISRQSELWVYNVCHSHFYCQKFDNRYITILHNTVYRVFK
jgi:hypothetical protein